ncbi:Spy/CpxP family protein refolding chaperone [Romeria aff. gracilis LEGE 07310]|uniref:Spy/CpxP family protein refolding chaperone n=2 Tax=Vasconcelosia TaxID=3366328 RepID=A0A8J7ADZ4_9CYAN|nr:Spy/CpxP family protein refolding chaperone [Romeria aff. gracilis LEGE 07310]
MDTLKTSAVTSFEPVCAELPADDLSTPERLDQLQMVVDSSSAAIAQVRPAFDTFYASLTEAQQQALNRSISQWQDQRHGSLE